jgi:hypothetical protein
MGKKFVKQLTLISTLLLCIVLLDTLQAAPPNPEKLEKRDQALKEADQIAFKENMEAYDRDVKPFLAKYCNHCHGQKKMEGDLALDILDADMKESTSGARWAVARQKLEQKEMPPQENRQPGEADIEKVLTWIKAEMKRARRNFTHRIQFVNGNHVPHELLFDPNHHAKLEFAPRIRRHSPDIYEVFRKEQAKGYENLVGNPFTPDPKFLFKDMGAPKIDVPTTSQLLRNALTVVERQTGHTIENGQLKPMIASKKEFLSFVDLQKPFGPEEMELAIKLQFQRTLGREPDEDEKTRFLSLMQKNVKEAGRVSGVRYTLAAVFLLPEAVFRFEVGSQINGVKKTRLTSNEIAIAIAYALTDKRAPDWLVKDAQDGKLDTSEEVAAAVTKIFADPKTAKPRILRFFHEYFEYPKSVSVFKNPQEFKAHKARVLVSDTDNLIRWILDKDQDVIIELLTTNKAFINTRYDSNKKTFVRYEANGQIHKSYSLPPDWKWTDEQPIEMPAGTRSGILTQPSWLVAWSINQDNHAILRGKWIRERLLGNVVPDIPITVDAQLPEDPEKSLRERMSVTREEYCWQCHKLMNQVGLPFERFDHFGRWRATEVNKPVVTTGGIDLTGDKTIDGTETADITEFIHALAKSERVEQVFIRHVFRYFVGRNENLGDGPTLQSAQKAYRDSGGSFKALVTSILSSESFLYRTPNIEQTTDQPEQN